MKWQHTNIMTSNKCLPCTTTKHSLTPLSFLLVSICRALRFCLHSFQNHGPHFLFLHPSISHNYLRWYFSSFVRRKIISFIQHINCQQQLTNCIRRTILNSPPSLHSIFVFSRFFFFWSHSGSICCNISSFQSLNSKCYFCRAIPSLSFSGSLYSPVSLHD